MTAEPSLPRALVPSTAIASSAVGSGPELVALVQLAMELAEVRRAHRQFIGSQTRVPFLLRGTRASGKSSLLARLAVDARAQGQATASISLRGVDNSRFSIASTVADALAGLRLPSSDGEPGFSVVGTVLASLSHCQ